VDKYRGNEASAEQLLAALRARANDALSMNTLHRLFSDQFPSSRIPPCWYHYQKTAGGWLFDSGHDFIVGHIQRFPISSSLIDVVPVEKESFEPYPSGIWHTVFQIIDPSEDAFHLAERVRYICRIRGMLSDYIGMWGNLQMNTIGSSSRSLFMRFQEGLCYLDLGESHGLKRMFAAYRFSDPAGFLGACAETLGRRLALKEDYMNLVEWCQYFMLSYTGWQDFMRGADNGFKEVGNEKGLLRLALELPAGSYEGMRRVLKFLVR
jgi:hypothetical protein